MATLWIDTPGSELASRDAPIRFVVSDEPSFVSVRFPSRRAEELAFRDGVFVYPYSSSTRQDGTFTLRRSGGWPSWPTAHVQEAATAFVGPWGELYHVDFRTLPPATFSAPGSYTIDGLEWWVKSSGHPAVNSNLGIDARGLFLGNVGGSIPGSFYPRSAVLPLANVPGYNPAAPVVFSFRNDYDNGGGFGCGVTDCAANADPLSQLEFHRRQAFGVDYSGGPVNHQVFNGQNYSTGTSLLSNGTPRASVGRSLHVIDRRSVAMQCFDWSVDAPDPHNGATLAVQTGDSVNTVLTLTTALISGTPTQLVRDMSRLAFFASLSTGNGPGYPAWLAELIIWQPGAGA